MLDLSLDLQRIAKRVRAYDRDLATDIHATSLRLQQALEANSETVHHEDIEWEQERRRAV